MQKRVNGRDYCLLREATSQVGPGLAPGNWDFGSVPHSLTDTEGLQCPKGCVDNGLCRIPWYPCNSGIVVCQGRGAPDLPQAETRGTESPMRPTRMALHMCSPSSLLQEQVWLCWRGHLEICCFLWTSFHIPFPSAALHLSGVINLTEVNDPTLSPPSGESLNLDMWSSLRDPRHNDIDSSSRACSPSYTEGPVLVKKITSVIGNTKLHFLCTSKCSAYIYNPLWTYWYKHSLDFQACTFENGQRT